MKKLKNFSENPSGSVHFSRIFKQIRKLLIPSMLVVALLTFNSEDAKAQGTVVTGTVTESQTKEVMAGVNIQVKGSSTGTITGADGKYSISAAGSDAVLVFSFIGYSSKEIPVEGKSTVDVELESEVLGLDEVVVVGYGTQKKVNVIGSVSQITPETIENRPVTNLSNALTGQMTGVTVIQRSGKPGFDAGEIRIRGVGSFGATPTALILVDGVPGSMNEISINDIESISVLKDASSAAIYGARAANGVILVTTKKGREGISVSYNGYYGISTPTEYPDLAESWEYAEKYNIAIGFEAYSAEDIEKYKSQSDPDNYPNTDFLRHTLSRNGKKTGHDLSLTGGRNANRYFLSVGYLNEQGLVVRNDYNRYNFRLNLENELSKTLTLTTRLSGSAEEANEPTTTANKSYEGLEDIIQVAVRFPSIYIGQASNGDFGEGPESGGTPYSWLASKGYVKTPTTKAGINSRLDWKPFNSIVLSAIGGYNFTLNEQRNYRASQVLSPTIILPQATLEQYKNNILFKTIQFLAEYNREFKSHNINALAGYSFEDQVNQTLSGKRIDFPSNDYTVMSMGGINSQQVDGDDSEWAIQSFFGRLKYNFDERYLFEFTIRRDGSSRFPPDRKYGVFPSFAAGWRLSQEEFFSKAVPWVSNLKLKASWGQLGNQNIGNYPYQTTLASGRDYAFGSGMTPGAAYRNYRDPFIHWESTEVKDIGFESGFFEGKLMFNLTYFDRFTRDILYRPSASVSSVLGVGISETNTGEVKNHGWEFELGHRNSFKDFSYQVQGNLSVINNEVVTLGLGNVTQPNGMVGNGSTLFIGYPMEMYYGFKSDGVFISEEDISQWPDQTKITPSPQPGDLRYVDLNGPEGVPDGIIDANYDRTFIGSRIPKYTYGFNLSAQYKWFDIATFFQGVAKVSGFLENYVGYAFRNLGTIQQWMIDGHFDPENPQRYPEYPRLEIITNVGTPNTVASDFWILNASYLRFKNFQAGFTPPKNILNVIRVDKLRLYFSGENLFSINKYREGWDPEINTSGDYYPILSTYTLGINATF